MGSFDPDSPEKQGALRLAREFFAFVVRGRYFWVRPVKGGCGPAHATLAEARYDAELDAVYADQLGPVEILEVRRGDRLRRVWCSDPALMDAPITRRPDSGEDFFPSEWVARGKPTSRDDGDVVERHRIA